MRSDRQKQVRRVSRWKRRVWRWVRLLRSNQLDDLESREIANRLIDLGETGERMMGTSMDVPMSKRHTIAIHDALRLIQMEVSRVTKKYGGMDYIAPATWMEETRIRDAELLEEVDHLFQSVPEDLKEGGPEAR